MRTANEAGLHPLLAVLNSAFHEIGGPVIRRLEARGCRFLENPDAAEGMASSIRVGIEALRQQVVYGAVVLTCDQVAVRAEHLRALCVDVKHAAGSGYAGKVGVPAYFPVSQFANLRALQGDQGARALLGEARAVPTEALALDVDTEEDLARAEAWVAANERATGVQDFADLQRGGEHEAGADR